MTVTRTAKGTYRVQFRHRGRPTSRVFTDPRDAATFDFNLGKHGAAYALDMLDAERDAQRAESGPTVAAAVRSWIDRKPHRPNTLANYRARLVWVERHPLGATPLAHVRRRDVENYLAWLADQDKVRGEGKISSVYQGQIFEMLSSVFRHEYDRGTIPNSPMAGLSRPEPVDAKPTRSMSDHEIAAVFAHAPDADALSMFNFLLRTGVRISEAQAIQWDHVRVFDDIAEIRVLGTKTKNARRTITVAEKYLPADVAEFGGFLFDPDRRYHTVFRGMVNDAERASSARAAGFEPMEYHSDEDMRRDPRLLNRPTPHTLRHTFITRVLSAGANPVLVAKSVGHASADFSFAVYTHPAEERQRFAFGAAVSELFEGVGEPGDRANALGMGA